MKGVTSMKMSEKRYLMDLTRDIVVSKLTNAAPNYTNADTGANIASMYEAIYNKLETIFQSNNVETE